MKRKVFCSRRSSSFVRGAASSSPLGRYTLPKASVFCLPFMHAPFIRKLWKCLFSTVTISTYLPSAQDRAGTHRPCPCTVLPEVPWTRPRPATPSTPAPPVCHVQVSALHIREAAPPSSVPSVMRPKSAGSSESRPSTSEEPSSKSDIQAGWLLLTTVQLTTVSRLHTCSEFSRCTCRILGGASGRTQFK